MCAVSVCVCDPAKLVFLEQPFPRKKWSNHKAGKCTSSHSCTQSHLHNQTISEYLFWDAFRLSLSAKNITSFLDNTSYYYREEKNLGSYKMLDLYKCMLKFITHINNSKNFNSVKHFNGVCHFT